MGYELLHEVKPGQVWESKRNGRRVRVARLRCSDGIQWVEVNPEDKPHLTESLSLGVASIKGYRLVSQEEQ